MRRPSSEKGQISEGLEDLTVHLADVAMPVSEMCGGVLVVAQTAAGKTRSVINNLARQFAEMFSSSTKAIREQRQFALIYLALKGGGHRDFVDSLSKRRRADVVTLSNEKTCPWVIRLFKRSSWASTQELHLAVVAFVEQVAERLSRSRTSYRHDPFWDRQRTRLMDELARLEPQAPMQCELLDSPLSELLHDDALVALLGRIEAFVAFIEAKATSRKPQSRSSSVREELKRHGFGGIGELKRAEKLVSFFARSARNQQRPKIRGLCEFLVMQLQNARAGKANQSGTTVLEQFAALLDSASRQRLHSLLEGWWRIPDITRGVIETDLRGVLQHFRTGPAEQLFRGEHRREITIEEVIQRGLIMIIDLPAAESGSANWPALVALKLAITQRLLSRYTALHHGTPLSRRGVVIVQDEAQLLLSDSEAKALSVVREFGVVWLVATQSVSLIASVLSSHADTAAFVAAARVRIWGATGDDYTAEMASRFCGSTRGDSRPLACVWHPTPRLEAAVTGHTSTETPLVHPQQLYTLKTGQFLLRTSVNEVFFLDLRLSLPRPMSRKLSTSGREATTPL